MRVFLDGCMSLTPDYVCFCFFYGAEQVIVGVISFFVWLVIFEVDVSAMFLSFSTILLSFTFVFGGTAATFFEGISTCWSFVPVGGWMVAGWLKETEGGDGSGCGRAGSGCGRAGSGGRGGGW